MLKRDPSLIPTLVVLHVVNHSIINDQDTRELLDKNNLTITELKIERDQYSNFEDNTVEVVEYGLAVLGNLGVVWDQLEDIELKQRFQKFIFPSGLSYDGQIFGTANLPLCIRTKDASLKKNYALVAHTGFEPVISSLRGRCPKPLDECATHTNNPSSSQLGYLKSLSYHAYKGQAHTA